MVKIQIDRGKVMLSWRLSVTPEGNEEEYYLNVVEVDKGKVMCKSFEKFVEGEEVIINQEICRKKN